MGLLSMFDVHGETGTGKPGRLPQYPCILDDQELLVSGNKS